MLLWAVNNARLISALNIPHALFTKTEYLLACCWFKIHCNYKCKCFPVFSGWEGVHLLLSSAWGQLSYETTISHTIYIHGLLPLMHANVWALFWFYVCGGENMGVMKLFSIKWWQQKYNCEISVSAIVGSTLHFQKMVEALIRVKWPQMAQRQIAERLPMTIKKKWTIKYTVANCV